MSHKGFIAHIKNGGNMQETKVVLPDREIPRQWYNIMADMPNLPKPPLHPGTRQPIGPQDLSAIFPMALIEQEVSTQRWIDIPEEVLDLYSPLETFSSL